MAPTETLTPEHCSWLWPGPNLWHLLGGLQGSLPFDLVLPSRSPPVPSVVELEAPRLLSWRGEAGLSREGRSVSLACPEGSQAPGSLLWSVSRLGAELGCVCSRVEEIRESPGQQERSADPGDSSLLLETCACVCMHLGVSVCTLEINALPMRSGKLLGC